MPKVTLKTWYISGSISVLNDDDMQEYIDNGIDFETYNDLISNTEFAGPMAEGECSLEIDGEEVEGFTEEFEALIKPALDEVEKVRSEASKSAAKQVRMYPNYFIHTEWVKNAFYSIEIDEPFDLKRLIVSVSEEELHPKDDADKLFTLQYQKRSGDVIEFEFEQHLGVNSANSILVDKMGKEYPVHVLEEEEEEEEEENSDEQEGGDEGETEETASLSEEALEGVRLKDKAMLLVYDGNDIEALELFEKALTEHESKRQYFLECNREDNFEYERMLIVACHASTLADHELGKGANKGSFDKPKAMLNELISRLNGRYGRYHPFSLEAQAPLGRILFKAAEYEQAVSATELALIKMNESPVWWEMAVSLRRIGRNLDAKSAIDAALGVAAEDDYVTLYHIWSEKVRIEEQLLVRAVKDGSSGKDEIITALRAANQTALRMAEKCGNQQQLDALKKRLQEQAEAFRSLGVTV